MAIVASIGAFISLLVAPIPDVSSSFAITAEFTDSIRTDAVVLAFGAAVIFDAVIDINLTPCSGITGGTGTGVIVDTIDAASSILAEVDRLTSRIKAVINVGTASATLDGVEDAIAGKATVAHTLVSSIGVGTRSIGIAAVGALLAFIDVGTSSTVLNRDVDAITTVASVARTCVATICIHAVGVDIAVMD